MARRKSGGQCGNVESMKASYREAKQIGDREEESRWANQIGHVFKDRGEYVEALKWFRLDYEIASGRKASGSMSPAGLMPSCQSMGEIYSRMQDYKEALVYQERHYQLAKETGDVLEQQRASTQLGRSYLDLFERDDDTGIPFSTIIKKCQEFFTTALNLVAQMPQEGNAGCMLADAHNNLGLMKMVFDDHREAEKYLYHALKICDDEEVAPNNEVRSRIHHNLGRLYTERRNWQYAKEHMQLDIMICKVVGNLQGEVKGLINLGDLSFKTQNYEDAMKIYKRALTIVGKLQDEDALAANVRENIQVVKDAEEIMQELSKGLLKLQKLQRDKRNVKKEYILLGKLVSQAETVCNWDMFLKLTKQQKRAAKRLGDSGKIGDAFGMVAQAYYHLRSFEKAKKWHLKSFQISKRSKNLEGQSIAKNNYGNALDANGEWEAALKAYEEAYELAVSEGETEMLEQQKSALENMQYAYNIRFEDFDRAREVESKITKVKFLIRPGHSAAEDELVCLETDSDSEHQEAKKVPPVNSRKRHRIVLSDDDTEEQESASRAGESGFQATPGSPEVIGVPSTSEVRSTSENGDFLPSNAARTPPPCNPNESSGASADRARTPPPLTPNESWDASADRAVRMDVDNVSNLHGDSNVVHVNVDGHVLHVNLKCLSSSQHPEFITVEAFLEEVLRLYKSAKPEGPHPILRELSIGGAILPSGNIYKDLAKVDSHEVAVSITGWIPVPLVERYDLACKKHKFKPSLELQSKLKIKIGEVDACDCDLDDVSIWPLLLALDDIGSLFSIKLAHNQLGRLTGLQKILGDTKNSDTGLLLDLHDNNLVANSLSEISKCSITLRRLEVIILSGNLLTDGVGHDLARILEHAPRLHTLKVEECGLTTLTCQKLTNALQSGSCLQRLSIGKNNPIAGYALTALLKKLATLPSFEALDISGLQVCGPTGVEGIVHLIQETSTLSQLLMRQLEMRPEFWERIGNAISENSSDLSTVDVTGCKILPEVGDRLYRHLVTSPALATLSLAGNHLSSQSVQLIVEEIKKPNCVLRKLDLSDCGLSQNGVVSLLKSLRGNSFLAELRLAGNCRDASKVSSTEIVADSEDEGEVEDGVVQQLSKALSLAAGLKCLDLSSIEFVTPAAVVKLYSGWSDSRSTTKKHVKNEIVHFSVEGFVCCYSRQCCI
ncbi:protein TONSOKU isoform X2 [Selaginella moellendorffii]|uniref:protein TONSOKU isoform X2 n=1 Tax=Selaginella moellendorffii TaxID=88036 RepID=UPI000D1D100E|nr:protein TONSOKU isoform X2 [Selaginella moellendorffii]|eukprot:XP_024518191.1 protein TONSOKU isoform X2 [Selaginella moellendorffii]